ncbi:acyl-CoA synthetase [Modestobacter sp. Leaf380]|uniref:acyl-CoA synthetase n=1 Tax=Modestobacter sp. Leaf380 TaxID=1736356 RepID=UPI000700AB62|nr:acyl-CoA synthetase [Modestobacter sp. Leaf380]KQS68639.1 acyl-CoA synthetase [Modestobacter sp. Leaf380]
MYPGAHDPGHAAVVMSDSGATLTYGELEERSVRLAHVLWDAGLRPGDDVALLADNSLHTYEVFWAAMRSGLYLTAINQHLKPGETSYILGDCDAKAIVVSASQSGLAQAVVADTPGIGLRLAFEGAVPGHQDYEAALAAASSVPFADQPRGRDMLYSSGTTGRPKGVKSPLPGVQVSEGGEALLGVFGPLYGFGADTVYLSPAPLYHAAPLRFGGMVHMVGGTVVVMPRFDAAAALAAIERYRVTHSQWVPTMFVRMLKLDEAERTRHDLSSHRVAVHAAAPMPVDVKAAMIEWWGPVLAEYYAATEAVGVTLIDSATWLRKPGSVGKAGLGVLHVCADDGTELPPGEVGLVYFEREVLPFSYHNDPEKTARAQHPQHPNWGTTGDLGRLDEDGFLYLTDRQAFMVITGGVNVYPQEIEDALTLHPDVADLAVIGVPDEEMGEAVQAVVQAAPHATPGPELEAELLGYLRERIAHFKVPRGVLFVEDLPRTLTGKLRKHEIRDLYLARTR